VAVGVLSCTGSLASQWLSAFRIIGVFYHSNFAEIQMWNRLKHERWIVIITTIEASRVLATHELQPRDLSPPGERFRKLRSR
jgi:hypothetical protein